MQRSQLLLLQLVEGAHNEKCQQMTVCDMECPIPDGRSAPATRGESLILKGHDFCRAVTAANQQGL